MANAAAQELKAIRKTAEQKRGGRPEGAEAKSGAAVNKAGVQDDEPRSASECAEGLNVEREGKGHTQKAASPKKLLGHDEVKGEAAKAEVTVKQGNGRDQGETAATTSTLSETVLPKLEVRAKRATAENIGTEQDTR
ncbi:hypothetical protein PF005_g33379, partial [Phytophthora fragariae]